MYNQSQNPCDGAAYSKGATAFDQLPPEWVPSFLPDGQYTQNWYTVPQGSSSSHGIQQSPPQPPGYPPGHSGYFSPAQNMTFPSSFNTSVRSSVSPKDHGQSPSNAGLKIEKTSSVFRKKRKKLMADTDGTASVGSPSGDGDKEKRTKTGRACDACVSNPCEV